MGWCAGDEVPESRPDSAVDAPNAAAAETEGDDRTARVGIASLGAEILVVRADAGSCPLPITSDERREALDPSSGALFKILRAEEVELVSSFDARVCADLVADEREVVRGCARPGVEMPALPAVLFSSSTSTDLRRRELVADPLKRDEVEEVKLS